MVGINSSSSFPFRTRCKFCKSYPQYYIFILDRLRFKDFRISLRVSQKFLTMFAIAPKAQATLNQPSDFRKISTLSFKSVHSKVSPRYNKNYGLSEDTDNAFMDAVTCACNKTIWRFKAEDQKDMKSKRSRSNVSK